MNSKGRIFDAMHLKNPDRVPVMCQLSIGHYFLHSGIDPFDIWFTSEGFANALITLAKRYRFDGVLVNLPGRPKDIKDQISKIDKTDDGQKILWKNGNYSIIPFNDNPHYYNKDGGRNFPTFEELEPQKLFYVDPWDVTEISYPFKWGFESALSNNDNFFPEYHLDTIKLLKDRVGNELSIHSEIFSPWSQFLELLNYENALMAILDDPGKVKQCLERFTEGAIQLAKEQAKCNVDAILISSAFAGGGLISREQYSEFVLPYEKQIIFELRKEYDIPIYTHTCGSIGDRLDLMLETGTNGIDTLDPPPLGNVELEDAVSKLKGKVFIKGNIDPVNTLLYGNKEQIKTDVIKRLEVGKNNDGYILSTACSVSPTTSPDKLELLAELAETYGKY